MRSVCTLHVSSTTHYADAFPPFVDKIYRKKSLMIHPDRFKHPRGPEAFDLLKKAEIELLDKEKRK